MSERCYNCFRAMSHCLCKYAEPVDSGVKFVLLMHPKEAKRERTGTGRLTHITLVGSEILVGLDFSENARLTELLSSDKYFPVLLYPGENTWNAKSPELKQALAGDTGVRVANGERALGGGDFSKTLLVLVIDATWFCAKKVLDHSPFLLDLPRISFFGKYSSKFTFKREPRSDYISTIESCYYLIKELQGQGLVKSSVNAEPLMTIFRKMVASQIQAQNDRIDGKLPDTHAYNWKYTKKFGEK